MNKGMTLIELLCAMAIVGLIAALALPATVKAGRRSAAWVRGVERYTNGRVDAFCDGTDAEQAYWATNKPTPFYAPTEQAENSGTTITR